MAPDPSKFGRPCVFAPFTWDETPRPEPGDFLLSTGGSGYLITGVREIGRRLRLVGSPQRLRLEVVRIDPATIPDDAVVHGMYWSKRQ